jgi:hypothetical protein
MIQSKMRYFLEAMKPSASAFNHPGVLMIQVDIPDIPICLACHTIGYSGEKFCPQCGTEFPLQSIQRRNLRYCQQCRQPIVHPVAFFCTCCGEPLAEHKKTDTGEDL